MATFLMLVKLVALFFAIFWTSVNIGRIYSGTHLGKVDVPQGNFVFQAASTTLFIWLQWL